MSYKDCLGNEVKAGDLIAYACSLGRGQALKFGRVQEIVEGKDPDRGWESAAKCKKLKVFPFERPAIEGEVWSNGNIKPALLYRSFSVLRLPAKLDQIETLLEGQT